MTKPHKLKLDNHRIGSYPNLQVVLSISTALFMIGLFALFALHAERLTQLIKENMVVQVFLDKNTPQEGKNNIKKILTDKEYLDSTKILWVSKETAAEALIRESGDDFISFLGENPLRDAFHLKIKADYYEKQKMRDIKDELEKIEGVFEVVYIESLIKEINDNIRRASVFIIAIILVMLLMVIFLVHNAVRLAIYSQRLLIRSMQLVGATAFFIKKPYLIHAVWQGFFGGFLASLALLMLLFYLTWQLPELALLQNYWLITSLLLALCGAGALICLMSAYRAVSHYLNKSLDDIV